MLVFHPVAPVTRLELVLLAHFWGLLVGTS